MTKNKSIILVIAIIGLVFYLCAALVFPKFVDLQISDFVTNTKGPELLYNNTFAFWPACPLFGGRIEIKLVGIGVEKSFCKVDSKLICVLRGGRYSKGQQENISAGSCVKR